MNKKNDISRTQNATRNAVVSFSVQIITTVLSFVNRSVFIKLLGDGLLGIDGLFTSILTMLSLAELGVGSAIIFNLYKPVADSDYPKVRQLMQFYAKAYKIIAITVASIGIIIVPFLDKLVNFQSVTVDINIRIIYLLFLANTCSSYFWAYKQSIIIVNQRQRVISIVQMISKFVVITLEIIVVVAFKNYYIYLIVRIIFNYAQAFIIGLIADKNYPEAKFSSNDKLPKDEKKLIFKNVGALMWYKVSNVFVTSTDNIMINLFIGIEMVGIFSNYTLIISAVQNVTSQIFMALTASIGNYNATENKENQEKLFRTCVLLTYLVYGICAVCLFSLSNRFILLLWGDHYILSLTIVAMLVLNFYFYGFQSSILIFRNTNGLFVQGKYRPLFSALINLVVSYILVLRIGVLGVVLGTVISRLVTTTWFDPYVLYKHHFKKSVKFYYIRFFIYFLILTISCVLTYFLTLGIPQTIWGFFISTLIGVVIFIILSSICLYFTKEYKDVIIRMKRLLLKR